MAKKQKVSANLARNNVRAICELEKEALRERTAGERFGDVVSRIAGKMWFIVLHGVWFGAWVMVNDGLVPGWKPFDPYPFQFLTLVVSLEAIFLSLFILMSQNRASRQSEQRAQLDLQINLLSELESTKMLQMLQAICRHHHLEQADDPEVSQLAQRTEPRALFKELQAKLPAP